MASLLGNAIFELLSNSTGIRLLKDADHFDLTERETDDPDPEDGMSD